MSGLKTPNDDSLTPADLKQVIAVCERFEQTWKQGRTQQLEELLGEVPEHLRRRLRLELCTLRGRAARGTVRKTGQDGDRVPSPDETGSMDAIVPGVGDALKADAGRGRRWRSRQRAPCDSHVDFERPIRSKPRTRTKILPERRSAARPCRRRRRRNRTQRPGSWHGVSDVGYEILSSIGRGGMGVVLKARHRRLNRLVALKLIRDGLHARPDLLVRLRIEAETLASLRHENIVQVYDVGELEGGDPFVALEYLEGGTLAAKLNGTPQPNHLAAGMSCTLARAIHARTKPGSFTAT